LSFEPVLRNISTRHILGLTATPYRKDGLEKIISMQCGSVVHTIPESSGQKQLAKQVIVRTTAFRMPDAIEILQVPLHEIWQALVTDTERLKMVAADVITAINNGRFPLILSDRKDHLELLFKEIALLKGNKPIQGFLITSEAGKRERRKILEAIEEIRTNGGFSFLMSTGSLIGEGLDIPELCTLMLAMPLSFKGRLVQYAGRLHRESAGKTDVRIYDYVDVNMALGISMFKKRMTTYKKMGYSVELPEGLAAKKLGRG